MSEVRVPIFGTKNGSVLVEKAGGGGSAPSASYPVASCFSVGFASATGGDLGVVQIDNSDDFTIDIVANTVTCNFDGIVDVYCNRMYQNFDNETILIDILLDGVIKITGYCNYNNDESDIFAWFPITASTLLEVTTGQVITVSSNVSAWWVGTPVDRYGIFKGVRIA